VLPILYNTFATLASLSRIKRMLKRGRLTALTRSDVVNRVIEIELPRYAVKPWDRFRQRDEYWSLSEHPSSIPGGSWTTFNWKTNTIGSKTQRVEYADQVRQPQADIAFDELICYLLDLGAVPDPQGWKLLRSSGLWTPTGCPLLLSPDSRHKALVVGPQDDADGNLSLVVSWASSWTTRDHPQLPPDWVRLPGKRYDAKAKNGAGETKAPMTSEERDAQEEDQPAPAEGDITCQILTTGITAAYCAQGKGGASEELPIDHLQISPIASSGVWFASAATAFGTTSQTILWNYQIPDELLRFARRETVPCGVLVLLGIVDETETPSWATSYNDSLAQHEQFARRSREMQLARQEEGRMAPDQRRIAEQNRMRREGEQRLQDCENPSRYFAKNANND
jgi:hypothetical protein